MQKLETRPWLVWRCCLGLLLWAGSALLVAAAGGSAVATIVGGTVASADTGLGYYDVELVATRGAPHR